MEVSDIWKLYYANKCRAEMWIKQTHAKLKAVQIFIFLCCYPAALQHNMLGML